MVNNLTMLTAINSVKLSAPFRTFSI